MSLPDYDTRDKEGYDDGKPECKLIGEDGNVFSIIGNVRKALKNAGQVSKAKEFMDKAFAAGSYDEVLRLATEYVEVV